MPKTDRTTYSLYWPKAAIEEKLPEKLDHIAKRDRRSINFLITDAIREFIARDAKQHKGGSTT